MYNDTIVEYLINKELTYNAYILAYYAVYLFELA
jgi:hypothetical protein